MKKQKKHIKKLLLFIILLLLFIFILKVINNRYNEMFTQCDTYKGYKCSYYEARLFELKGN